MRALGGRRESDICRLSFNAFNSSSMTQVSTTIKNIGGITYKVKIFVRLEGTYIEIISFYMSLPKIFRSLMIVILEYF